MFPLLSLVRVFTALAIALPLFIELASSRCHAAELRYRPAPIDNPLKGFIAAATRDDTFPHSLTYVQLPLARLMQGDDQFNWTLLDNRIEAIASRGCHAVIRIHVDWPGARESGIPKFLLDAGVRTHEVIPAMRNYRADAPPPDYEDPLLRSALKSFIAAFGRRYDGHSDIAFIEAGLLGMWGEWLPWRKSGPSPEVQAEVLAAYEAAFRTTKVLVRWPSERTLDRPFGYHDDWFGHRNGGLNSRFEKLGIAQAAFWRTEPMGGRIHPEFQACLWNAEPCGPSDEEYHREVRAGHFTYLRLPMPFKALWEGGEHTARALKWAQALGYEFHAVSAAIDADAKGAPMRVSVTITNSGAAPFYYRWPVELALAGNGSIAVTWQTDWDIRTIMPGAKPAEFTHRARQVEVSPGQYQVLLRARNPASRGRALGFANETQDADLEGWLSLGHATIFP